MVRSMVHRLGVFGLYAAVVLLSGCASYRPLPLPQRANLASDVTALRVELPAGTGTTVRKIDVTEPLSIEEISFLAILNNPDLTSERGERSVAAAALLQASLLPNPSATLGLGVLVGGPGTTTSYAASLSEDIAAIVTYRARERSAEAHLAAVDADLLWQEWQVAQKARLLAFDLYWASQSIALDEQEEKLLSDELANVKAATAAGNLDLAALSPLLGAKAASDQALGADRLDELKNWQALNALLGVTPEVRFAIAPPDLAPMPADIDALIAGLPDHRPDLVALQMGYRSSDETVRAAILGQFPAFTLGGSYSQDNSGVSAVGPAVTFELPIFNRNQGQIAAARATRLLLHEQYQSRLDSAASTVRGLVALTGRLEADLVAAREAARSAQSLLETARSAYAQGNLDQRSFTEYETTVLQREREAIAFERGLGEDRITLMVELGLGLPQARVTAPDQETDR
jgi:outer membrane protein TolC